MREFFISFDELTMRVLLVVTGLAAGYQAFTLSKRRPEPADSGQWGRDPTRNLTRVRDLFLILTLGLVFSVAVSPSIVLINVLELSFPLDSLVQTIGICLIVTGSILGAWALRTLGEFASERIMIMKNHRLVQTGPYRFVRHPMYGSTLLIGLGLFLLYLNIIFLILLLPIFAIDIYRAKVEEKMLASPDVFGTRYQEYRSRTRRFIPYIF
ncbi:MAG TPA: isoprenylcysteine carboxylmethyltransferase family protein [Candidatus Bathyarchaeia archaeon]|nr:isoprenylcysteine carboxylmethyltransferase family protein [Candidatus Bathyarchaeia archaeon]